MTDERVDRILSQQEIDQLKNLLVPTLKNEYPNFEEWLEKASKGITDGSRIAFGMWKESLVATSIVKMTAGRTAELKSFFINPDFRHSGYGDKLYETTEGHCRKSGFSLIVTDVYCDNTPMVEFLISKGYSIGGKLNMYGNDRPSYIMSKNLVPEYIGDPYDWEELGQWFLSVRLRATEFSEHPEVQERKFDRRAKIIINGYSLDLLVEVKDQLVDLDDVQILHKNCSESSYHLPVFIAREFSERARKYAESHGILAFDAVNIGEVLGKTPERFREGAPAGMIVGVKSEYLGPLMESKPPAVYVKGGPGGKFLEKEDVIAFYETYPVKQITAVGIVSRVDLGTPNEIWQSFGTRMAFTKEEYQRFSNLKRSILAITLSSTWRIEPIREKELDALVPKKDRSGSYIDIKLAEIMKSRPRRK